MIRLFLLYALSGFVSLGYQVAWFRIFTDWFGSTNLTFALVVCMFIGGLGVGALLSRPLAGWVGARLRIDDRLRVYGVIELLVGATALLTLLLGQVPADLWGGFPYTFDDGIWVQNGAYRFAQVAFAVICVFVPCVLMGVTFPLICNALMSTEEGDRLPAALYAWNTFGACAGVLVCQFLLLKSLGHSATFLLMVVMNLCIGAYFVVAGGAPAADAGPAETSPDAASGLSTGNTSVLLLCAILSGLLAGALEGDMFKRISFAIQENPGAAMACISFWAIFGIFLASTAVRVFGALRLVHIKIALIGSVVFYLFAWDRTYPLIERLTRENYSADLTLLAERVSVFPADNLQLFWFVGFIVFVPYLLVSLLLPYVCNRLQAQRRHLGVAYGLNTLAFCIGLVGFTLIAPRVSIFYSLKLSVWLLVLGTGLLLLVSERRRVVAWQPLTFAAAFLAACLLVPPGFDPAYLQPGGAPTKYPVRAVRSNGAVTTFVVSMPTEERLYFGNLSMSGTNDLAQVYMRLMAHIPLLAQRAPRKALLICFGVGNTASAIAAHAGIEQIDIVDLNHQVFATAPEFSATHGDVHLDPRVRLIHDDGRNFLRVTDETYDLITSEPPPPMSGGVYRLYTAEYYADIRRHLTPDGVMSQWLPIYQMPGEAVDKVIATFVGAFPHTLLFVGYESELILVGSAAPIDLGRMTEGMSASPSVAADLARIGIVEPVDLLARVLRTDASLRREYAGRGVLSDERNDLEHLYLASTRIPVVDYDPIEVSDYIATAVPVHAQTAREVITHLGRLRYRVPRFPVLSVRPDPDVALSDADWPAITRHIRDAQRHVRANQVEETIDALTHAVELAPAQPAVLEILADQYVAAGLYDQAILTLRQFQTVEPGNARSHGRIGGAYLALGRSRQALPEFRRAIELDPASPEWLNNAAWILATHADGGVRQPAAAIGYAERAARLTDNADANVLDTLGVAYASAGRFADAVQVTQHAIDVARRNRQFDLAAAAQRRRARYQREQRVVDPG